MKVGKYEFQTQEEVDLLIEGLGDHRNDIEFLSNFKVVDEEVIELDKIRVDVLWLEDKPLAWLPFEVQVEGEGVHSFKGISYQENK